MHDSKLNIYFSERRSFETAGHSGANIVPTKNWKRAGVDFAYHQKPNPQGFKVNIFILFKHIKSLFR